MTMLPTYFPSPPQGVWHLGPLPIRAYALFIITGIVAALVIGDRRWQARGGQRGVIYDIALWAVPFGLVGGRLYHLATDWRTYWGPGGAGFFAALRIWDGGLGIWGAIALGGVGAWIACRRRGIPLAAFADALAPGLILAQAIGRLGNYFNQELYGRETAMPWGLEIFYRRDPSGYVDPHSLDGVSTGQLAFVVQPTFLYELIWNVLVFVMLIYVDRRFKFGHGRLFALYVAAYCVGRFCVELLRDDTATHIAGIRINMFTSTFVFIGAVVYIILAPKGREDPESLRGTDREAEEAPEPEPEPEPLTGASVTAAAGVAGVLAAGKTPKRLIPRTRSSPVKLAVAEAAEAETVKAGAEVPDAEAEEPETVEGGVAEPEVAEAEAAESTGEEPETAAAEVAEPEVDEAEAEEPETAEGGVAEPEVAEAEAAKSAGEELEAAAGGVAEPEVAEAEAAESTGEEPETAAEVAEPEVDEAQAQEREAAPENAAEVAEPEVEEAEGEEPEIDAEAAGTAVDEAQAQEREAAPENAAEVAEPEVEEAEGEEPEIDAEAAGT
ncbi:MAG: prolipoprotein diacylglyceryl transferase, partial [Mycobacterium sp.]|uniref:prolipoprotein diacylglyceryl transferase n=1 Tax=Mycobacterium sp. TaxID=1785 RepID=UPI003F953123